MSTAKVEVLDVEETMGGCFEIGEGGVVTYVPPTWRSVQVGEPILRGDKDFILPRSKQSVPLASGLHMRRLLSNERIVIENK